MPRANRAGRAGKSVLRWHEEWHSKMSDQKKTYLARHKPTGEVFGSFTHEIHAKLFLWVVPPHKDR